MGGCHQPGVGNIPSVLPGWFKVDAGVGHSLAMWHHPWVSTVSCTLSPHAGSSISLLTAPSPHIFSYTFCQKTGGLSHLSRPTHTIMRIWTTTVASSAVPTSMATFPGTTQDTIWCLNSAVPSTVLVVTVFTLIWSWVSSFVLSAFWAAIVSWEYNMLGCCIGTRWSSGYVSTHHGRGNPWSVVWPLSPSSSWGTGAEFGWGSPPAS